MLQNQKAEAAKIGKRIRRIGGGGLLKHAYGLELVSKELNHFEVIADLFRQIGDHSSRFVLFCSF